LYDVAAAGEAVSKFMTAFFTIVKSFHDEKRFFPQLSQPAKQMQQQLHATITAY